MSSPLLPPHSSSDPHPLAERLITRLRERTAGFPANCHVLELGTGSGRNVTALRSAGIEATTVADSDVTSNLPLRCHPDTKFAAVLTTHGFLHGYPDEIATLIEAVTQQLVPQGLLYATFGSKRDARFGTGEKLGEHTFAPTDGDERGVPHTYLNESEVLMLLEPYFEIERIEEIDVDTIAGSWAHRQKPLTKAAHWFIEAHLR